MYGIPTEPDITPTSLFNPSKDDFTDQIAEESGVKPLVLPSRVIVTLPKYMADHVAKHLARKLATDEDGGEHFDIKYDRWIDKIYVKI